MITYKLLYTELYFRGHSRPKKKGENKDLNAKEHCIYHVVILLCMLYMLIFYVNVPGYLTILLTKCTLLDLIILLVSYLIQWLVVTTTSLYCTRQQISP